MNRTGDGVDLQVSGSDLEALANWATQTACVRRMYLFSSRVKGTARSDSDLDIAIEIVALPSDTDAHTTWVCEAATWQDSLMGRVSLTIDLEWHDASEANQTPNIRRYLANASVVVYPKP